MRLQIDKLGKVAITVEQDYWSNTKDYDKLTIVEAPGNEYKTYISRKPVPAGTALTNRIYWIPFSSLREEIVLDFNTFVALWTENLATTNARIDASNTRIEEVNDSLLAKEENLYNAIASIVVGGVALKQEFGDSEVFGISQKILTESRDSLQNQINDIVSGNAVLGLTVTSPVFVGEQVTINIKATSNTNASVSVTGGNLENAITGTVDNTHNVTGTDTITPAINGIAATYQAIFTISGVAKTKTTTVTAVYPIKYGAGAAYTDITTRASVRTSYKATYNITNSTDGNYIWFLIPASISTTKPTAKMNGFDFPLDDAEDETIDGVAYKVYKSSSTQDAGSFPIVLS